MEKTSSGSPSQEESFKKKLRRTEIRAEQEQRARLEARAELLHFLPKSPRRVTITSQERVVSVGGKPESLTIDELAKREIARNMAPMVAQLNDDFQRYLRAKAQNIGAEEIDRAKAELEGEHAAIRTKVLDAAESGVFTPFLKALARCRFSLFRDKDFLALVEKIDDTPIGGNADAGQQLPAVLDALFVGSGRHKRSS